MDLPQPLLVCLGFASSSSLRFGWHRIEYYQSIQAIRICLNYSWFASDLPQLLLICLGFVSLFLVCLGFALISPGLPQPLLVHLGFASLLLICLGFASLLLVRLRFVATTAGSPRICLFIAWRDSRFPPFVYRAPIGILSQATPMSAASSSFLSRFLTEQLCSTVSG